MSSKTQQINETNKNQFQSIVFIFSFYFYFIWHRTWKTRLPLQDPTPPPPPPPPQRNQSKQNRNQNKWRSIAVSVGSRVEMDSASWRFSFQVHSRQFRRLLFFLFFLSVLFVCGRWRRNEGGLLRHAKRWLERFTTAASGEGTNKKKEEEERKEPTKQNRNRTGSHPTGSRRRLRRPTAPSSIKRRHPTASFHGASRCVMIH